MTSPLRTVSAVRIFVNDLDGARRFYGDVLELAESASGLAYAIFDVAGVSVVVEALAPDDPERGSLVGRFLAVSFGVDDVEATYRRLRERGVAFLQTPEKQSWGRDISLRL